MDNGKTISDWIKFLNPDEVKFQLICSSLYITAYELLIDSIVKKTRDFYINGYTNGEMTYDEVAYKEVRSLYPKDIVVASAMWISDLKGIDLDDIEKIKKFKNYRNELAHELPKFISDSLHDIKIEYFQELRDLYRKIHKWWFTDYEATINSDFDHVNLETLDYDEVLLFAMLPMNYMINIVNDEVKKREERKKTK